MQQAVTTPAPALTTEWRGRERFAATWDYQLACHRARRDDPDGTCDRLILVEHEPVVTLGKQGDIMNLPGGEAALAAAGIDFHRIERGGDITYHGPGQLMGYPIIHLRKRSQQPGTQGRTLRDYMRGLEETLIRALAEYGLRGERIPGMTGVWVDGHKLAAIGVAVQGGVTYHGFALNIAPDLSHFGYIVPCGIADKPVGSMASLLAPQAAPGLDDVRASVEREFRAVFVYSVPT